VVPVTYCERCHAGVNLAVLLEKRRSIGAALMPLLRVARTTPAIRREILASNDPVSARALRQNMQIYSLPRVNVSPVKILNLTSCARG